MSEVGYREYGDRMVAWLQPGEQVLTPYVRKLYDAYRKAGYEPGSALNAAIQVQAKRRATDPAERLREEYAAGEISLEEFESRIVDVIERENEEL